MQAETGNIRKIEYKNVEVLYDNSRVNEKMAKSKNRLTTFLGVLWCMTVFCGSIAIIFITTSNHSSSFSICDFIATILVTILIVAAMFGGFFFIHNRIYRNLISSFLFIDRMFKIEQMEAGWYNDDLLLIANYKRSNESCTYWGFDGLFIDLKKNSTDIIIDDQSDKSRPIYIIMDATKNKIINITIKNN